MSIRANIIANYVGQFFVTLTGILMLPLYIKYMGAEAYGLVGFFTMLQAWFGLLDLGLSPTIGRETARYHGNGISALDYRRLYRILSLIFIVIAINGGGSLFLLSENIATNWLKAKNLPLVEIVTAVRIMAISAALRWMCGLYRGVVTGSEKLVWLSCFNMVIATLRFVCVMPVMFYFGFTPVVFFIHQLIVAIVEFSGIWLKSRSLLPSLKYLEHSIGWSFKSVKPVLKFALTIAITSSIWVLVTQTDKFVLSGILTLGEYGYYTLAVLVANAIMIIGGPVSNAVMPRMARLHAEGKNFEMMEVYRNSTQLVSVIAGSATITIVVCSRLLLFAWTGDHALAVRAAPILSLYAIGNGFLVLAAFAYYLQYAKGNLRYHLVGNVVLVVILIPCIVFAASSYGAIGAGYVWLISNALYLFCWVAYVHHKIEPGLHLQWLIRDILTIGLPALAMAFVLTLFKFDLDGRVQSLIYVISFGAVILFVATISSGGFRSRYLKLGKLNRTFYNNC